MKQKQIGFLLIAMILTIAVIGLYYNNIVVSKPPPPIPPPPGETASFSVYQALRVIHTDGKDSWKYPQTRTAVPKMTITDLDDGKAVFAMQSYVFFSIISTKSVSVVAFNAEAQLSVYDSSKSLIAPLSGGWIPISESVPNPTNATDTYVGSVTITADTFEQLVLPYLAYGFQGIMDGYYVMTLQNINAVVSYSDGTSQTFGLTGIQETTNQLWWKFQYSNTQLSIVQVQWLWK